MCAEERLSAWNLRICQNSIQNTAAAASAAAVNAATVDTAVATATTHALKLRFMEGSRDQGE